MSLSNCKAVTILSVLILLTVTSTVLAQVKSGWPVPASKTTAPASSAPKAVMRDGHPAVECASSEGDSKTWLIEKADLDGKPAFKIPVVSGQNGKFAIVFVSADRIALESHKPQDSFDEDRAAVLWKIHDWSGRRVVLELKNAHHRDDYFAQAREDNEHSWGGLCCELYKFPVCESLVETAFTDFPAAEKRFAQMTRSLPPMREAEWREFQPKANAWRLLPAKPPISDDVKQHRLLAEDAFNQKQFDTAAAEYEAGLEIDPLWAQGQFNAAYIHGELKDYDDAVWHMRCYLELMPNAPDAQTARDQMLLWQAKAEQAAAAQ